MQHVLARHTRFRMLVLSVVTLGAGMTTARQADADSTAQNLEKYAELRLRLDEEFVAQGEGPGHAMPVHERVESEGLVRWADASIRLGWYIGLLATEHHLRQNPDRYPGFDSALPQGVDVDEQLYYALLALERLDEVADSSFPDPCTTTPALNGFFIRDDVPESILASFPGATSVQSDFLDPSLTGKEMSQDQAYHVLLGLALVKRFVDVDVQVQGQPLRTWAVEQAHRIGEHIAGDGWLIRNPACDRLVARGEDARGFSKGAGRALSFITDGALETEADSGLGELWDQAVDPEFIFFANSNVMHMGMALAAIGQGWEDDSMDALVELAEVQQWWIYPMLLRALHDDAAYCAHEEVVSGHARAMLDEFPLGGDVASTFPEMAEHGFTTSNRFIRPLDEHYIGSSEGRRYNGLDYLLLHNVYAIASPSTWEGGDGLACDRVPPPEGTSSSGGSDSSGGDTSASTGALPVGTTGGASGTGDAEGTGAETPDSSAGGSQANADGCSCRSGSGPGPLGPIELLCVMLWMRRRRILRRSYGR